MRIVLRQLAPLVGAAAVSVMAVEVARNAHTHLPASETLGHWRTQLCGPAASSSSDTFERVAQT
jgi:hypothetical protein